MDGSHLKVGALIVFIGLTLASCSAQVRLSEQGGALTIACSDSLVPLAGALTDEFRARQPHVAVQLQTANGETVEEWLAAGRIEVALTAGPLASLSEEWQQRPVALEGLAVIVHPQRGLTEAGFAQIRAMFSGRVAAWAALGQDGGEIQPVSREDGATARRLFESTVMGDKPVTPRAIVMPTSALMVEYVAAHPDAIGYAAAHWADATVKPLAVEGALPGPEAVGAGSYPLVLAAYLVWPAAPSVEARAFADFAASPAGRAAVVGAGYAAP